METSLILRHGATRATTRGWNSYNPEDPNGHRAFRYLTPKKRLEASDLTAHGLHHAKSVHLICSPSRCAEICEALRETVDALVWEPVPDLCTPETKAEMLAVCPQVDIISPNESELASFFSGDVVGVEAQAKVLLDAGVKKGTVVRAGKKGCYVLTREREVWLPAYWEGGDGEHKKVVDSTGGGNTFLGALSVGLGRGEDVVRAAAMGNVAAGFAVEQIGLPGLGEGEVWNGEKAEERWEGYLRRLKDDGVVV